MFVLPAHPLCPRRPTCKYILIYKVLCYYEKVMVDRERRAVLKAAGSALVSGVAGAEYASAAHDMVEAEEDELDVDIPESESLESVLDELADVQDTVMDDFTTVINHPNNVSLPVPDVSVFDVEVQDYIEEGYTPEKIFAELGGVAYLHEEHDRGVTVPMLARDTLDVDLNYLVQDPEDFPYDTVTAAVNHDLAQHLPGVDSDVRSRIVETDEPESARELLEKGYSDASRNSDLPGSIFCVYVMDVADTDVEQDGDIGVSNGEDHGLADDAADTHVSYDTEYGSTATVRVDEVDDSSAPRDDIERELKRAVWRGTIGLPYSAARDDIMSSNPKASDADTLATPSTFLLERYLDGEFEVEQTGSGIRIRFDPGAVDGDAADDAYIDHVETYLEDMTAAETWGEDWEMTEYHVPDDGAGRVFYKRVIEDTPVTARITTGYSREGRKNAKGFMYQADR